MRKVIICLIAALALAAATGTGSSSGSGEPTVEVVKTNCLVQSTTLLSQDAINKISSAYSTTLSASIDKIIFAGQKLETSDSFAEVLDMDAQDSFESLATSNVNVQYILYPKSTVTASTLLTTVNAQTSTIINTAASNLGLSASLFTVTSSEGTAGTDCDTKCISENSQCPTCGAGKPCTLNSQCQSNLCSNNVCSNPFSGASAVSSTLATIGALAVSAAVAAWM